MTGVALQTKKYKEPVMKAKPILRGEKIYIDSDLTPAEREIQPEICRRKNNEEDSGKRVKLGIRKIIINGRAYRYDERERFMERNPFLEIEERMLHQERKTDRRDETGEMQGN